MAARKRTIRKRSRAGPVAVEAAAPSKILFIALDDASYVPDFLVEAEAAVLRRCLPRPRLGTECENIGNERPWERAVKWNLDGIPLDSFGAGAVQIVLKRLEPEKIYIAVEELQVTSFSERARRSLYDVAFALSRVKVTQSRRVYFAFPPLVSHRPAEKVLSNLMYYLPVSGFVDGDVSSVVFQARATWLSAKRLDEAEKAAADSLRASLCVCKDFHASEALSTLPVIPPVDEATSGMSRHQRVIWSGSIAFPNETYRGFELVDFQTSGSNGSEGPTLRFPPGACAAVVGHDDQRVVLGAFAFTAPRFEIRASPVSEMSEEKQEPALHLCAALLVALKESKRNILLTICDSAFYCSWRWVRSPMSLQHSWLFVATEVPHPSRMGMCILDVPSFRRETLGLVGRSPIFSSRKFLNTLPYVDVDSSGPGPPLKRARFRVRDSPEEVAAELMSRRQLLAPGEKQDRSAEAASIRKLCYRKSASISAPERKLLKRWDDEREVKRKRAEAKGIDDASLIGASLSQRAVRTLSSLQSLPMKQVQKDSEDDPAAVALRSRRALFCVGAKRVVASDDGALRKPLTAPKHLKHLQLSIDRPRSCGSRSLPSHLFALSSKSSLPTPSSRTASRIDRMKGAMSLTNFLDSLTPFQMKDSFDASPRTRPNGFSVGLSSKALRWQELVPSARLMLADESSQFQSVGKCKWDHHREHGIDICSDQYGDLSDPVDETVVEMEEKSFVGGSDLKSAFPFVSRHNRSKELLEAVKYLV